MAKLCERLELPADDGWYPVVFSYSINVVQEYTWSSGQGDYDGDGKSDIFWRNSTGKTLFT